MIYFIQGRLTKLIKIGKAIDCEKRLIVLQGDAPHPEVREKVIMGSNLNDLISPFKSRGYLKLRCKVFVFIHLKLIKREKAS